MRRIIKGIVGVLALGTIISTTSVKADAGVSVYVGKDVSVDGTTFIGGEYDSCDATRITVVDKSDNKDKKLIHSNGFEYNFPTVTYKYQIVGSVSCNDLAYAPAAMNEYGLAVSVSPILSENGLKYGAISYTEKGIDEEYLASELVMSNRSAREAIDVLADIIDKSGSSSSFVVTVADQDETWYMEVYGGYDYAAIKLPEDVVAVYGDKFYINNSYTEKFESVSANGLVNISSKNRIYKDSVENIDISDLFAFYRGENAESNAIYNVNRSVNMQDYCSNTVNIIQIYNNTASRMADIMWSTFSAAGYAPFIPVSNMITEAPENYSKTSVGNDFDENIASDSFLRISSLCKELSEQYSNGIREYWEGMEQLYIAQTRDFVKNEWADLYDESPEEARKAASTYCNDVMVKTSDKSAELFDDLIFGLMHPDRGACNAAEDAAMDIKVTKSDSQSEMEDYSHDGYSADFDVAEYAEGLGWTVSNDEGYFEAVKNDTIITIKYSEDGKGLLTVKTKDSVEYVEIEDTEEVIDLLLAEYGAPPSMDGVVSDVKKSAETAIGNAQTSEIYTKMSTLTYEETADILREYKTQLISSIQEFFGKGIDSIELKDIEDKISQKDVEALTKLLSEVQDESQKLVEKYTDESIDVVLEIISKNGISEEQLDIIIEQIRKGAEILISDYIEQQLNDLYGVSISAEELTGFLDTFITGAQEEIEEYFGKTLSDITEEDVLSTLEDLDSETKEAMGNLFGVNVDEAIQEYRNEKNKTQLEISIDVPEEVTDTINSVVEYIEKVNRRDTTSDEIGEMFAENESEESFDDEESNDSSDAMNNSVIDINESNEDDDTTGIPIRIKVNNKRLYAPAWCMRYFNTLK